VAELDGVWEVERTSGALPPLPGVVKRIRGARGETTVGRAPGIPFDVDGLTLRYRPPLSGFVDYLDREGEIFRGRATFRGRDYGTFILRPIGGPDERGERGDSMEDQLRAQLIKHIDEGIAMEQNVLRMLDGMIQTTDDQEIKEQLRQHKLETERHADRLRDRLSAHGATPSMIKEAGGVLGALMKIPLDMVRPEKAGRNARDAYATEHMEIASYELLERIATRAGDEQTAEVARQNRGDEEQMAQRIAENWDRFAELSLREQGVTV
jgi:ferritin-like metal-binding protein YciE